MPLEHHIFVAFVTFKVRSGKEECTEWQDLVIPCRRRESAMLAERRQISRGETVGRGGFTHHSRSRAEWWRILWRSGQISKRKRERETFFFDKLQHTLTERDREYFWDKGYKESTSQIFKKKVPLCSWMSNRKNVPLTNHQPTAVCKMEAKLEYIAYTFLHVWRRFVCSVGGY